jgi:hypothetical protein
MFCKKKKKKTTPQKKKKKIWSVWEFSWLAIVVVCLWWELHSFQDIETEKPSQCVGLWRGGESTKWKPVVTPIASFFSAKPGFSPGNGR